MVGSAAYRRAVHGAEADSTWSNTIHLGTQYAALLVGPGYRPPDRTDSLPQPGGDIVAVASVKGTGNFADRPRRTLKFSGHEWEVREVPSDRGGANDYDPENAWTDPEGLLHLRLAQRDGRWTSAEAILARALGYGTYASPSVIPPNSIRHRPSGC